jgi:uncharacterized protein
MHILITGGTGLIGRHLAQRLLAAGARVTILSRRPETVRRLCGDQARGIGTLAELGDEPVDRIVNLAGAPIADRPWTARRKAELWASRVTLTEQLVEWIGRQPHKPSVLVSGSAVGWYGDGGDQVLTEDSQPGPAYTHTLCDAWEAAARRASAHGVRVCLVRTGLVIAAGEGFLKRMLLPFKLGLGGRIGSGRQYMPWVHLDDEVGIIEYLLGEQSAKGVYNATAPNPVSNSEFARTLAGVLGRPAFLPLPGLALKAGLGEMASLLLMGQNAQPARLLEAGYPFKFERLDKALTDVLNQH